MKYFGFAVVTLSAALAQSALAQSVPAMTTSATAGEKATTTFFTEDSVGDVQLGRLGQQRAQNAAVRMLASAMVRDHTKSATAGMEVANAIGNDEAKLKAGDENQIALSHLARYRGAKFDREYVNTLIDAHKSNIGAAHDALEFSTSPQLRAYLATTIAVDQRHLRMALAAQEQVGKKE